jgi:lysine-N-methylase
MQPPPQQIARQNRSEHMNTHAALVPQYMVDFKCIGSECEDSCCIGWRVEIDKRTYQNLTNVPQKTLGDNLKDALVKNEAPTKSDTQFAFMKMNSQTGCCSMLNEQKLCTIQAALGEGYLSPTCATYPRNIHYVNEQQEISAVMSCPEAARLALLNPNKMEFTYIEAQTNKNIQIKANIHPDAAVSTYMEAFWPIRAFAIEMLQNRDFSFAHRLILLGLFCEELQKRINQKRDDAATITGLIEDFKVLVRNNEEIRDYKTFPVNQEFQFIILNNIVSKNMDNLWANARFSECLTDYLEGLEKESTAKGVEKADIVDRYSSAHGTYYQPFIDKHEHIFENFAVNFIYSHLFPKTRSGNVFKIYMLLVSHFVLLKLILIGMSAKHKGLTSELVIKLIQSFSRISEHSNIYVNNTLDLLEEKNYNTMGHMSLLIKN